MWEHLWGTGETLLLVALNEGKTAMGTLSVTGVCAGPLLQLLLGAGAQLCASSYNQLRRRTVQGVEDEMTS